MKIKLGNLTFELIGKTVWVTTTTHYAGGNIETVNRSLDPTEQKELILFLVNSGVWQ